MKSDNTHNNPRYQAYQALKSVIIDGHSLTQVFSLNPDLTAFAKAICFGVMRDYQRLLVIINKLVAKKPKKKALQILLMMGIFQLKSSDKPDYASVTETVSLTRIDKIAWASAMVNGVLRRFTRERETILSECEKDQSYQDNHPHWLVDMLSHAWPDKVKGLLIENDRQAPMTLRVNLAKITCSSYHILLEKAGIQGSMSTEIPTAVILSNPVDVTQLPGFSQGMVSVQDAAAQLAASLLKLEPGQRILDACCAPGGKTCHILESEPNLDEMVAIDVSESRLDKVRENLERLNLQANLVCADALQVDKWWDGHKFDRILLDAPCSATGVIRRHPDIKFHRKREDIFDLVAIQQQLLDRLWTVLKPGGLMLYATCSVLPEENEQQIESFCRNHVDAKLEPITINLSSATKVGLQLFPTANGHDGFYYAVLRKMN